MGRWAAPPLLLAPVLLSGLLGLLGLVMITFNLRVGGYPWRLLLPVALACGPALWFAWRVVFVGSG